MPASDPVEIVRKAAAAFNAGRSDEARRLCEAELQRTPGQPVLHHFLAAVLFSGGDFDGAQQHVTASLATAPGHAPARLLAAKIARARGDAPAALDHLARLPATPPHPEALLERARALSLAGHADAAREAWQAVLTTSPDSREAMARLGRLAWEAGDRTAALAHLTRATEGDCPASTWFDLGLVRQDLHDYRAAAEAFRKALDGRPDHAEAAVNLGISLQENGDVDAAMAAFATAYRLQADTFGAIAMALTSSPHGKLWLDQADLRRALQSAAR